MKSNYIKVNKSKTYQFRLEITKMLSPLATLSYEWENEKNRFLVCLPKVSLSERGSWITTNGFFSTKRQYRNMS